MDWRDATLMVHAGLVLVLLWAAGVLGWNHSVNYFLAFFYLLLVNERYTVRLRKRLQHEERKSAYQRRLLHDSEQVRWLNHAAQKMWPLCLEKIVSEQFLAPVIPWFLDKFKPWTVEKAVVQKLYLGRNAPLFTEMRVLPEPSDDDHLVLEIGMNFLTAEDMNAILAVQLSKTVGLGITTNMHLTSMHVEGKILVGVKFLRHWPFLGRIRLCFIEPPYFQMTVKPLMSQGLDVTVLPGISQWLDSLLDTAFGQTLVQPNMLVMDVEKFVSSPKEKWFDIDEKPPVAILHLEILEGADLKPADLNGLADPYVKGHLGNCRFRTKIQWKTLNPKWTEEFRIPITSWDVPNELVLQVYDKDPMFDDHLGDYTLSINDLKGGQRHDKWLSLKNVKKGRIHIGLTLVEGQDEGAVSNREIIAKDENSAVTTREFDDDSTFNELPPEKKRLMDEYEPINIEGQEKTGVWVHHPGTGVLQTWEPRKGRARQPDIQIFQEIESSSTSTSATPRLDGAKPSNGNGNGNGKFLGLFRLSKKHKEGDHKPPPSPGPNSGELAEKQKLITYGEKKNGNHSGSDEPGSPAPKKKTDGKHSKNVSAADPRQSRPSSSDTEETSVRNRPASIAVRAEEGSRAEENPAKYVITPKAA